MSNAYALGLNRNAAGLKEGSPAVYAMIKSRAVAEWEDDHTMVVFVINQQADSLVVCDKLFETNRDIVVRAVIEWCDGGLAVLKTYDDKNMYEAPVDWAMVEFISKRQIDAEGSY
ncbi:MAG: hypothetical protein PF518_04855 [Spirochaetaceae bacterium]|nr:hypothetical protein [Spirochaetaceae bacterium]